MNTIKPAFRAVSLQRLREHFESFDSTDCISSARHASFGITVNFVQCIICTMYVLFVQYVQFAHTNCANP